MSPVVITQIFSLALCLSAAATDICYHPITRCYELADKCGDGFWKPIDRSRQRCVYNRDWCQWDGWLQLLPNGESVQTYFFWKPIDGSRQRCVYNLDWCEVGYNLPNGDRSGFTITDLITKLGQVEILQKEKDHNEQSYPVTRLDPGETAIVPHCEVRRFVESSHGLVPILWTVQAMVIPCTRKYRDRMPGRGLYRKPRNTLSSRNISRVST